MVNNQTFYLTTDRGRLHIADETSKYGGSVNSYNNVLTRFFSRLFRKSMSVEFGGEKRTVNKNSYEKFLKNNGIDADKESIYYFDIFHEAMEERRPDQNWRLNGHMRDHLSRDKSAKLFRKLVHALEQQDADKAKKLAGQGADIESVFWERQGYGISFHGISNDLPNRPLRLNATRYNPILYAAKNYLHEVVQFLIKIGSSTDRIGYTDQFRRKFSHIETRQVPYHRNVHVAGGTMRITEYRTETITHYKDKQKTLHRHHLDANFRYVTQ